MNKAERIPVDSIILDNSNPRIKHYLEMYTVLNEEHMLLALGAGAEDEGGSTALGSYERLKHSIRASGGIIQSIIVKPFDDERFLCIEGNTRVAIYRQLRNEDKASGQSGEKWDYIPALVSEQMDEEEAHKIPPSSPPRGEPSVGRLLQGQVPPRIGRGLQNANGGIGQLLWWVQDRCPAIPLMLTSIWKPITDR